MQLSNLLLFYLLIINCISFITMMADKKKALKQQYRISERTLWLLAWIGGAIGATAGMHLFRHKTKHLSFKIGFPLLMIIELGLVIYILV